MLIEQACSMNRSSIRLRALFWSVTTGPQTCRTNVLRTTVFDEHLFDTFALGITLTLMLIDRVDSWFIVACMHVIEKININYASRLIISTSPLPRKSLFSAYSSVCNYRDGTLFILKMSCVLIDTCCDRPHWKISRILNVVKGLYINCGEF